MKKTMFRKIAAILLILVLIFTFAACKNGTAGKPEKVVESEKKVAILVAPESQYPEDYRAAQELAAEYPEKVIVKEYSDSRILRAGDPEIMQFSKELASDPQIGAIIYSRATQFTTNAIRSAESVNPNIVTICVEPEESIEIIMNGQSLISDISEIEIVEDSNDVKYAILHSKYIDPFDQKEYFFKSPKVCKIGLESPKQLAIFAMLSPYSRVLVTGSVKLTFDIKAKLLFFDLVSFNE